MSFINKIKNKINEIKEQKEEENIIYKNAYKEEKNMLNKEKENIKEKEKKQRIKDIKEKAKDNVRNPFYKKLIKKFDSATQKVTNYIATNLEENEKEEKKKQKVK